jgi:site-specific DNA recombinase
MRRQQQAILYARFSPRPGAAECDSIEKQLSRLRAWCVARDVAIAGEYSDADASGASTDGRDGLEEALRHACKIRGVFAVYDLSRLSRKALDALAIAERLMKRQVNLMLLIEQIDTTTAIGRMVFTIQAGVAQYFRECNSARTSSAMLSHQRNGRRMTRLDRVPFGFRACSNGNGDMRGLEIDQGEHSVIETIKALAAEGKSSRAIGAHLDAQGIMRRGKKWRGAQRLILAIVHRS